MAKRKITPTVQDNTPDYLVKPKKQFEIDLVERIKIGEELLKREMTNQGDYGKLYTDYNFWHDYNCEFLKRAFDKTNNQYYKDYTWTPGFSVVSMVRHTPSLREEVQKVQGDISKHLTRLQKI